MTAPPPPPRAERLSSVRQTVRGLLESSPAYLSAPPRLRRKLATELVGVSMLAADQLADDLVWTREASARSSERGRAAPLAEAQAEFGEATRQAGQTVRDLREALDFPTFVTNLITGVFQSISTSSLQQLESIGQLLETVSGSSSEFASDHISDAMAIQWAVGAFSFLQVGGTAEAPTLEVGANQDLQDHVQVMARRLEATEQELSAVADDELNETLLPLIKRKMGRDRQQNLATMVMMGVNRVVVDEGRLHASMDLRVDTRSLAEQRRRERSDVRVDTSASAQFGMGAWGAAAKVSASVGYVNDNQTAGREEIATQSGLRSSVDLVFHTEPVSLNTMVGPQQQRRIRSNSRVPAAWENRQSMLSNQQMTTAVTLPAVPGRTSAATPPTAPTPPALRQPAAPAAPARPAAPAAPARPAAPAASGGTT